jgi:hypothetical protein
MLTSLPPRLRAPAIMALGGAVVLVVGGAIHGWSEIPDVAPVVIVLVVGYWLWARRDSDYAAVMRREPDERQADIQLKVQALVGQVMSLAAFVAYLVASAAHLTMWPFIVLVCLPAATFLTGWRIYRDA